MKREEQEHYWMNVQPRSALINHIPLIKQKLGFAIDMELYFLESNDGAHGHRQMNSRPLSVRSIALHATPHQHARLGGRLLCAERVRTNATSFVP